MKAPDTRGPGPKPEDGKPPTDDGLRSPVSGPESSAPADPEAPDDLAGLLDRTDRVLGTGPIRGGRAAPTGPERAPVQSADVRDGDRLSTSTPGTMLDLLTPASIRKTDRDAGG